MADSNKRLLQVFISHTSTNPGPGIFEVSTDPEKNLTCNCPGYKVKRSCKHIDLVASRIKESNGLYPFDFYEKVTTAEIREAMKSEEDFRAFIIKYGKVEVY
jgi:hypothetical protein